MSDKFKVTGGIPLSGDITLSGSKNGGLPTIAATLLVSGTSVLHNVPDIADVTNLFKLMSTLGVKVKREGNTAIVDASNITGCELERQLATSMRGSYYLIGPLLARVGKVTAPMPGGCSIGARPVDYIMQAIRSLGVQAVEHTDEAICTAPEGLIGGRVMLDPTYRSPGATFNALLTAVLAKGQTVIDCATEDPEMTNLCEFLINAGAKISGIGTRKVIIEGVDKLHDVQHTLCADRIEGGTFLLAGAATRGKVTVGKLNPMDLGSLIDIFTEMGVKVEKGNDYITVDAREINPAGTIVSTQPFPGFPTDLQPPLVAMMCQAKGRSVVHENIYSGRMGYINELRKMGARIKVEENKIANIEGVEKLDGRLLEPADMRAGAALVVAALSAQGESLITGRHFIIRGYENLENKLKSLGAVIDIETKCE